MSERGKVEAFMFKKRNVEVGIAVGAIALNYGSIVALTGIGAVMSHMFGKFLENRRLRKSSYAT